MSLDRPPPPELKPTDLIRFVESHRPYMDAGDYTFYVEQVIEIGKVGQTFPPPTEDPQPLIKAYVQGDRLSLAEDKIHAVFPPDGARGRYGHVLPHVILNRSSLPWERVPQGKGTADLYAPSWLALLVLSGKDAKTFKTKVISAKELTASGALFEKKFALETGQHETDQVRVLEIPWDKLQSLLPRYHDLATLAHVRHVSDAGDGPQKFGVLSAEGKEDPTHPEIAARKPKGPELAVVVANRLPTPDSDCTVHLVSLENRFVSPIQAATSTSAGPLREPMTIHDPDLVKWFGQTVLARRQAVAKAAKDDTARNKNPSMMLELKADSAPTYRQIDDRDAIEANDETRVPRSEIINKDRVHALCREVIGQDTIWSEQLAELGAVSFLTPLNGPAGYIALIEAHVHYVGSKERPLKMGEADIFARILPQSGGSDLGIHLKFDGTDTVQTEYGGHSGFAIWINAQARLRIQAVYDRIHAFLTQHGRKNVMPPLADSLGAMMAQRADFKKLIDDHIPAKPHADVQEAADKLRNILQLSDLKMVLNANNIAMRVQLTPLDDGHTVSATIKGQSPLMAGRFLVIGDEPVFDAFTKPDTKDVRLVTLKSWSFYNKSQNHGFTAELFDLNPDPDSQVDRDKEAKHFETSAAFHVPVPDPQAKPNTVAAEVEAEAARYIRSGSVALRHGLRGGGKTLSWYHGPFVTDAARPPNLQLPVSGPDALLVLNKKLGMYDVSYAAAWELGRLIMLEDNDLAQTLFHWKRDHARSLGHVRQRMDYDFLPLPHEAMPSDPPKQLSAGFARLTRLEPVPFNYLVPDETMLPVDSIRFFSVDPMWLAALRDGAFSVGRVLAKDHLNEAALHEDIERPPPLSGFLLRSRVVSDFPHLTLEGYTDVHRDDTKLTSAPYPDAAQMKLERMSRLGRNVMLCLFSDPEHAGRRIEMVDIHLPAEVLHFGLEVSSAPQKGKEFKKENDPKKTDLKLIKHLRDPKNGKNLQRWAPARPVESPKTRTEEDLQPKAPSTQDRLPDDAVPGYQITPFTQQMLKIAGASADLIARLDAHKGHVFEGDGPNLIRALAASEISRIPATMFERPAQGETGINLGDVLVRSSGPVLDNMQVIEKIPMRDKTLGVLDMTTLLHEIGNRMAPSYDSTTRFSGADLALQMLDLPPKVRFLRQAPTFRGGAS
jgi:hypothetical protein